MRTLVADCSALKANLNAVFQTVSNLLRLPSADCEIAYEYVSVKDATNLSLQNTAQGSTAALSCKPDRYTLVVCASTQVAPKRGE